jgi:signal transduction histidine kinase
VHPSFEVACLAALVDEARAHLVARLTARAAARLAFTNDVDPTIRVEVDRHTLLQAFQNILQNGVEAYDGASDEASQPIAITVCSSSARQGAEVVLAFTDRGRGMSAEQLARAFIPFGSSKPGGTGVGMVVSRRMVEEVHGGTLTLESALGAGTTVRVALPALDRGARR